MSNELTPLETFEISGVLLVMALAVAAVIAAVFIRVYHRD